MKKYLTVLLICGWCTTLTAQAINIGLQMTQSHFVVPQWPFYYRGYQSEPSLSLSLGFNISRFSANVDMSRQVNTLTENYLLNNLSPWEIQNERKVRTQNYLSIGLGYKLLDKNWLNIYYLTGLQMHTSLKTYYWRQAANKSTREFNFNDDQLNTNYCLKHEIRLNKSIWKGLIFDARMGVLTNVIPYDELDELNIIVLDYRWAYSYSAGLTYQIGLKEHMKKT